MPRPAHEVGAPSSPCACHGGRPKLKLSENPVMRVLAVVVAVAVGIRLTFELLEPVWPYLLAVLLMFAVVRIVLWWRGRW